METKIVWPKALFNLFRAVGVNMAFGQKTPDW
jgi:hypothetical protein